MSRPRGSNKFTVALKCAKAGMYWMKGYPRDWIAKELKVTPRMVSYYLIRWSQEGKELLNFLKMNKEIIDQLEAIMKDTTSIMK